jgi:hypothetical protein
MKVNEKKATKKKRGFGVLDRQKARKDAAAAIKVFRRIAKEAGADLSVTEYYVLRLEHSLHETEEALNELLPPAGSEPNMRLVFDDDEAKEGATSAEPNGEGVVGSKGQQKL